MRKPSKYVERAELDKLKGEYDLVHLGLHVKTFVDPDITAEVVHENMAYAFTLYRSTSAHGGIVITTSRSTRPNVNGNSIRVQYFDELLAELRDHPDWYTHAHTAIGRLTDTRYRLNRTDKGGS